MTPRATLLFVDDRPTALTNVLLERTDCDVVLLRFKQDAMLPESHRQATAHLPTFAVDLDRDIHREARRFASWQRCAGLKVTHFLNHSEPRQRDSQQFAQLVGLPALSEEQVNWVRHKGDMKKKFRGLGFKTAEFAVVSNAQDVLRCAEQWGWPLVLKPAEGFACINTWRLEEPHDVKDIDWHSAEQWIVESFVAAQEWECCALAFDSEVLDTYLVWLPAPLLSAADGAINGDISCRHVPDGFPVDMRDIMQRLVTGLKIDHGYLHLDFFVDGDGNAILGELALRLAGVQIPENHGLAYGFSIFDALIDIHLGVRPSLDYRADRYVGGLQLPTKTGRVLSVTPAQKITQIEGILTLCLKVAPGDVIHPRRASHTSAGYVQIEGQSITQVRNRMDRVLNTFQLETIAC